MRPSLEPWLDRPVDPRLPGGPPFGAHQDCYEREVGREPVGPPGALHRRLAGEIMRFNVFPPWLATPVVSESPLRLGSTVGVWYHPVPGLGVFFASRVVRLVDQETSEGWRTGFVYQTLVGHPELGEELFCVTKHPDGSLHARLSSWSTPGTWLSRLFAPLVRIMQVHAGRAALTHLSQLAQRSTP